MFFGPPNPGNLSPSQPWGKGSRKGLGFRVVVGLVFWVWGLLTEGLRFEGSHNEVYSIFGCVYGVPRIMETRFPFIICKGCSEKLPLLPWERVRVSSGL